MFTEVVAVNVQKAFRASDCIASLQLQNIDIALQFYTCIPLYSSRSNTLFQVDTNPFSDLYWMQKLIYGEVRVDAAAIMRRFCIPLLKQSS